MEGSGGCAAWWRGNLNHGGRTIRIGDHHGNMLGAVMGDQNIAAAAANPLILDSAVRVEAAIQRGLLRAGVERLFSDAPSGALPAADGWLGQSDINCAFKGHHAIWRRGIVAGRDVLHRGYQIRRLAFGRGGLGFSVAQGD